MPRSGRASGCIGAFGGTGTAAHHGRYTAHQGILDLLRADEVNMHIEPAGGEDAAFSRDRFRTGPHNNIDAWLHIGVSSFADTGNLAVLDSDIGFDNTPVIEDQAFV